MQEVTIKDFAELLKELGDYSPGQNLVFRGVPNYKYTLQTSLGRCTPAQSNTTLASLEKRLIKLFKESAIPYLDFKPSNEFEWLAIGQHYGLPTRLLDWSYNPLVASFFAVEKEEAESAAVYVLWGGTTIQDPEKDPYKLDKVYKYRPPYISNRIQNQAGLFTIHHDPSQEFVHDKMKKIVIPREIKPAIKKSLFKYGINQRMIYPGLDGIAKDLKWMETKLF